MLILFKPWRSPLDLKNRDQSWSEALDSTAFDDFHTSIIRNIGIFNECRDARDQQSANRGDRPTLSHSITGDGPFEMSDDDFVSNSIVSEAMEIVAADIANVHNEVEAPTRHSEAQALLGCVLPQSPIEDARDAGCLAFDEATKNQIHDDSTYIRQLKKAKRPLHTLVDDEDDSITGNFPNIPYSEPVTDLSILGQASSNTPTHTRPETSGILTNAADVARCVVEQFHLQSNPEQLRAFNIIVKHLIDQDDQLLMYIGGVGGTGKSHVIKAIVRYFELRGQRDQLLLSAPTGAAAVLIGGATIHSLTLPTSRTVNLEALANLWRYIRLLIIDEVSMIGANLMALISNRLGQARAGLPTEGYHFGKISVVFLGDFGQLRPVTDTSLFDSKLLGAISSPSTVNTEDGQMAMQGASAWRQVETVVELQLNHRQAQDPEYAALLLRIREGRALKSQDVDNPNKTDAAVLRSRVFNRVRATDPTFKERLIDTPFIVGRKELRDDLNIQILTAAANALHQQVHNYYSLDRWHRSPLEPDLQAAVWRTNTTISDDRMGALPLFEGMKVMLMENVALSHQLVNGAEGVVHSILYDIDDYDHRFAKVCYVHFPNCGFQLPHLPRDVAPIIPTSTSFKHNKRTEISRLQLPLLPGYAYTDYKSQGRTLPRAIVDLKTANSLQGAYVMLSRVTSLQGLTILRDFKNIKIEKPLSDDLRKELTRLRKLDGLTKLEYEQGNIGSV